MWYQVLYSKLHFLEGTVVDLFGTLSDHNYDIVQSTNIIYSTRKLSGWNRVLGSEILDSVGVEVGMRLHV